MVNVELSQENVICGQSQEVERNASLAISQSTGSQNEITYSFQSTEFCHTFLLIGNYKLEL